ncbi:MAG: hypothetical protein PHP57_06935 [Sideroxydans sp.]|nr:hypothetical protein [Sideroxydans sp.]
MTNYSLVRSENLKPEDFYTDLWEPMFFDSGNKLCPQLPSANLHHRYLGYLRHRITRNPLDLLSHIRIVSLTLADGKTEQMYEALLSLFKVLGEKGESLRMGLLEKCNTKLSSQQIAMLLSQAALNEVSRTSYAETLIVRHHAAVQKNEINVLGEVRDYLENGQVELAQCLLEKALTDEPDNWALTTELLEIYRRSQNYEAALLLRPKLNISNTEVNRLWDDVLEGLKGHQ